MPAGRHHVDCTRQRAEKTINTTPRSGPIVMPGGSTGGRLRRDDAGAGRGALRHVRIAIATDAWTPQVNGVVTTLRRVGECLRAAGHEVRFLAPQLFRTIPCPTYPEIRLALAGRRRLARLL